MVLWSLGPACSLCATVRCECFSHPPDWLRLFNGPTLPVMLAHMDKRTICRLRLTCRMLGGMDSLMDRCFKILGLTISTGVKKCDLSRGFEQAERRMIFVDDGDSFAALGRLAPFVKRMFVYRPSTSLRQLTSDEELALIQHTPLFPNLCSLGWDWDEFHECDEGKEHPNAEKLLAFARLTPAVSRVELGLSWALIPGPFEAQLLSLWPQMKDMSIYGGSSRHRAALQPEPHTLLSTAASRRLLTELALTNHESPREFRLSALISNNQTSLRGLTLKGFIVSRDDLNAICRLGTLEKLTLDDIRDKSGNRIVSRDFLMALASVTTLKKLSLRNSWSCTAMDLVHFFRDAKFSLRELSLFYFPFTAALPLAIAGTQKYLEDVHLQHADCSARAAIKTVLEELRKMKLLGM